MRQELKFGELARRTLRAGRKVNLASNPVRQSKANSFSKGRWLHISATNHYSPTCPERSRRVTTHDAFLIDTLPIRITVKSSICSTGAHSNRHSSETLSGHVGRLAEK